ncbi:arylsulfatase [Cyclobacterium xiamenense]|uniref:arylsulfatase n=1 Tax=Cyclobacterium xiamenense TaxID=1297121 RepID=UPI0035D02A6C
MMKISAISRHSLGFLILFGIYLPAVSQNDLTQKNKPNIVLILVDDSGLMDFGAFGGEARTPNIDKLASDGLMFTNMHSSPSCSPSRAMLMTGSDSHLAGVANLPEMLPEEYLTKPGYGGKLNDRVQTIATRLKEANYNTYVAGKWHLGHDETTLPNKRGFDRSFILGSSGGNNYKAQGYLPQKPIAHWYADGEETELPDDFYSSKTYIDKTISFHEEEVKKQNPFFSYIAFQAIHAPVQAPIEFINKYRETYKNGYDDLRKKRFEKAKQMGFIPESAVLNDLFPQFKKWNDLSAKDQESYANNMAVTAAMLEAMDYHVGRYVDYLTQKGLMDNTIFIITSDNGPDGGDYRLGMPWALRNGYNRDYDKKGAESFFGYLGPEWANAVSSPFTYFKLYTGEGGVRVPLIITGKGMPKNQRSDAFCFFTDIAPTIYDIVGISTSANEGYAPITGKSILPHIENPARPVYASDQGVGLESANSAAYYLNGYKIVKNNIPLGDKKWHLYHIESDPGEVYDLAAEKPETFQKMLALYENYSREVGVIEMDEDYSAGGEVAKRATKSMIKNNLVYLIIFLVGIVVLLVWLIKRLAKKKNK